MRPVINLTSQRFGMLVALEYKSPHWSCLCDCGTVAAVDAAGLRRGYVLDCGCLAEVSRRELIEGMVAQRQLIADLQAQQAPQAAQAQPPEPAQATMKPARQASERREKVRELLAQGLSRKVIADQIGISVSTTYFLVPKEAGPATRPGSQASAGGRIDPVQYALQKARQERQAPMVLR